METQRVNHIQDSLIRAFKQCNSNKAALILSEHPELTNVILLIDRKQQTSTPLIEACGRGG